MMVCNELNLLGGSFTSQMEAVVFYFVFSNTISFNIQNFSVSVVEEFTY